MGQTQTANRKNRTQQEEYAVRYDWLLVWVAVVALKWRIFVLNNNLLFVWLPPSSSSTPQSQNWHLGLNCGDGSSNMAYQTHHITPLHCIVRQMWADMMIIIIIKHIIECVAVVWLRRDSYEERTSAWCKWRILSISDPLRWHTICVAFIPLNVPRQVLK